MKQIVQFNKSFEVSASDKAASVKEHLHDVDMDGDRLVFSKFDRQAFDLAAALEGLRFNRDYFFVKDDREDVLVLPEEVCTHTRPSLVWAIDLCLPGDVRYNFHLSIDLAARILMTPEFDEFPLVINRSCIELARILQGETQRFISPILQASLQIERRYATRYCLLIMGNRSSRIIPFCPSNACLSVSARTSEVEGFLP